MPTFKNVLELVLLQSSPHHFLYGWDILVEFDHQRVIIHALHVSHNGVVALLSQWDQVVKAMHPGLKQMQDRKKKLQKWRDFSEISISYRENCDLSREYSFSTLGRKWILWHWEERWSIFWYNGVFSLVFWVRDSQLSMFCSRRLRVCMNTQQPLLLCVCFILKMIFLKENW